MPLFFRAIVWWNKCETYRLKIDNFFLEKKISSVSHLGKFYSKKEKNG